MEALVVIVVLAVVVLVVTHPLRGGAAVESEAEFRVAELEARRDAKYREIRDLELDFRTGKMSDADHRILDRQLRAEAMDILHELDEAQALVASRPAPAEAVDLVKRADG